MRARMHRSWSMPLLCVCFAICGCHQGRIAPHTPTPHAQARLDTVWYLSARAMRDGRDSRQLADSLAYGLAIFRVRSSETEVEDGRGVADRLLVDSATLTRAAFMAALAARVASVASPMDAAVLYVHGFATSRHEAWHHAATAQALASSDMPWVAFCWPSNGAGLDWPRWSALLTRAYHDDVVMAQASRPAFAASLSLLEQTLGARHLVVLAHSLGAQLVGDHFADTGSGAGTPMRAIALLSADIDAEQFRDIVYPSLRARADRIALYVSSHDRALRMAERIHGVPRAGQLRTPPLTPEGLETVDITNAAREGWWQRHFGNHHSIAYAAGAVSDLLHIVGVGLPAACRGTLGTAVRDVDGVWHLRSVVHLTRARAIACATEAP